ncbi:MAG: DUF4315 family protein [Clostridia bacterium]|nr:DUF4315 family protein [Clostridia bacterium]
MNPKINKLKAEKTKNLRKIAEMTARNEEIDAQVTELENLDIIGMVRENAITPEQLADLIRAVKKNPLPDIPTEVPDETE